MHSLPAKAESSLPSHTERPRRKGGPRTSAEADAKANVKAEAKGRRKKQSKFRTSHKGDDSAGDPPLPIPNREVKPRYADGTAKVGE